jgi:hypothetical protein
VQMRGHRSMHAVGDPVGGAACTCYLHECTRGRALDSIQGPALQLACSSEQAKLAQSAIRCATTTAFPLGSRLPAAATASIGCCVALPATHGGGATLVVFEEELLLGTELMSSMHGCAAQRTPAHWPPPVTSPPTHTRFTRRLGAEATHESHGVGWREGAQPQQ